MAYKELKGNIFNSNAMALVNTVNCVGVMGKGIALEFKLRHPEMFKEYQKICFQGLLKPGQILPYKKSSPWILNFAIKDDWKNPSKEEWIEETFIKFTEKYKSMGIKSVAFPWVGAMNGGLPIELIKSLTRKYLKNLEDIEVEVYEFDTNAVDPLYKKLLHLISAEEDELSKLSGIKKRYWVNIFELIESNRINSMYELCNFKVNDKRVIGKTNIERLYSFLSHYNVSSFGSQQKLFID